MLLVDFQAVLCPLSQMEDFEYSVEISDRDWECFFAECEELNLPPPSLAGVDDSGMSDIDDARSLFAEVVQKVDLTGGLSDADRPIDGPPDCDGFPVDRYLSKHCVGGMESLLSGSEEDIHLQSVNIFFERLEDAGESEGLTEPCQVRAGRKRETTQEGEHCSGRQIASSTTLAKNTQEVNSLSLRGETAVAESTEPADTISKQDEPGSNISPESAGSNSGLNTSKSAPPESKLIVPEGAETETRENAAPRWSHSHDSIRDDVEQEDLLSSQLSVRKRRSIDCKNNLETVANIKLKRDPNVLQSDATSTNKTASQDLSPSASVRRKRRKKRRLSAEPAERQISVRSSDSKECAWRGGAGLCASEGIHLFILKEAQKHGTSSTISNLPVKSPAKEMKVNDICEIQQQYAPESIVRHARHKTTGLMEYNMKCDSSVTPLSQSVMSASVIDHVNGKRDLTTVTATRGRRDGHVMSLQQSSNSIHSVICCENERSCTGEVRSQSFDVLPSTESHDSSVDVSQSDILSGARSVLAQDTGYSGKHQTEDEPKQQLDTGCHYTDKYRSTLEMTPFHPSVVCMSGSDAHDTKPKQFNGRECPLLEVSLQVQYAKSISDTTIDKLSGKCCPSTSPSGLDRNIPVQPKENPKVFHTLSTSDMWSEKNTTAERAEASASQTMAFHSDNKQRETKLSMCEDLITSPSDITPESSCCTLDTESVSLLSNENITDMSDSSFVSVSQDDSKCPRDRILLAKQEESNGPTSQSVSDDSKCNLVPEAEDHITASKPQSDPGKAPCSQHSVFAMSSFWSDMEKLTINDILSLRMMSRAALHNSLPPLQESDSGLFAQLDESKPEQSNDDKSHRPNSVELGSGVAWESDPTSVNPRADIYTNNMMLTSSDISQPLVPGNGQMSPRKICKKISVQNLHALESVSCKWKGQTLQTLDEEELEKVECFTDGHMSKEDVKLDCLQSSATDSYSISLRGIFQYLFAKKQPHPSQSTTDHKASRYIEGNSVPETYEHFLADFDIESFFNPFITADQTKDELDPVFSHSANRSLQFPEAYEYFFASSSSDESSVESDEDHRGPVRVVDRFTRTSSASEFPTDIYDNFFTDRDLGHNFFWKNTFSFRNIRFARATVKQQNPLVPLKLRGGSLQRTLHPVNALVNLDVMCPDPFVNPLEDRLLKQLPQQPSIYEALPMTVSNPSKSSFIQ